MVFSDTSSKLGLIQSVETKLWGDNAYGTISGNSDKLYQFTHRLNRAQDRFHFLALTADGRWQFSDNNNTGQDIATTAIVSGQRDYTFALDHLEIEKVLILPSATSSDYSLIDPIDQDDSDHISYIENNSGNTGTPSFYDKRGNQILLDPTPDYSVAAGLKVYFKSGPSYFVYTDTTKVPGFASIFHDYLALHTSANYAIERGMPVAKNLFELLQREEKNIQEYYSHRERDERKIMKPKKILYI